MSRLCPALCLIVLALLATGCGSVQALSPGTYRTNIVAADLRPDTPNDLFVGSWTLTLGEDGTFTTWRNGQIMATGQYRVLQNNLLLTDLAGKAACLSASQSTGTYSVTQNGILMLLTAVDDRCAGRRFVLTVHAMTKE